MRSFPALFFAVVLSACETVAVPPLVEIPGTGGLRMGTTEITNAQYEAFAPSHKALRGYKGFSKADDETAKALPQVLPAPLTLPQLAAEFRESGDGAGGELGEKGDIQQQPEKAAGAAGRVPPGIHNVGDALEGEEGDAQGRGEAQAGPAGLRQGKHQGEEKAEILEGPQKRQVQNNGSSRQGLAPLGTAERVTSCCSCSSFSVCQWRVPSSLSAR